MQQIIINKCFDGKRVVAISLFGMNRSLEIVKWQKRVFDFLGIALNQISCPFPDHSHGYFLDDIIRKIYNIWDYLLIFDIDAIPLKNDIIDISLDKIKDGKTLFGAAQQSNHIKVNNTTQHVYVGPCFLSISKQLYESIGKPTFDHNYRGDCAEELTWKTKELGYNICYIYPSNIIEKCYALDNGLYFGFGTTYGDLIYHGYNQPDATNRFIDKCNEVLKT